MGSPASVRYEIIERLVSSEAVDLFEAVHPERRGRVLLEVFHAAREARGVFAACVRELVTVATLGHPNLWQGTEASALPDGTPMLVTERGQGCTLGDWLEGTGRIDALEVCDLMRELGAALDAAHEAGVVHGLLSAECVYLPDGMDAAPRAPQLQGFGRRWLQPLIDAAGQAEDVPFQIQRGRDICAFALLAERLLVPSALATEAIERRFALGPEVSAVIDRATRPNEAPFTTAGALAGELVRAVGQDGLALRPGETMAARPFAACDGEDTDDVFEPAASLLRRRWPLLATGAAAGLAALLFGLPYLGPSSAPRRAAVTAPASPPESVEVPKAPVTAPVPVAVEEPAPVNAPVAVEEPESVAASEPAVAMEEPAPVAASEPPVAQEPAVRAVPRPRTERPRSRSTFVWSPSLGRLVEVDQRGYPVP